MNSLGLYESLRPRIHTGDAVLWKSRSFIGGIIRAWSKSEYNHVSIAIRFTEFDLDRVYILEELERGAVMYPLSRRLEHHKGNAWIYPLDAPLVMAKRPMARWALYMQGTKYDYPGLFSNLLGRVSLDTRRLFCSEYYWLALEYGVNTSKYGSDQLRRASIKLHGKSPRPSDWPLLQKAGLFGEKYQIL